MDASQYKNYVLFMLFIKYISDKYGNSDDLAPQVVIPKSASFKDMVALKGKADIGDKINTQVIQPLIDANSRRKALMAATPSPSSSRQSLTMQSSCSHRMLQQACDARHDGQAQAGSRRSRCLASPVWAKTSSIGARGADTGKHAGADQMRNVNLLWQCLARRANRSATSTGWFFIK